VDALAQRVIIYLAASTRMAVRPVAGKRGRVLLVAAFHTILQKCCLQSVRRKAFGFEDIRLDEQGSRTPRIL
jgi:hypothetical protein